ncbi:hypothetical protein P5673_005728 [Acropora cervicornis]|uniref:Uncharacterized protein n=1 Tax=Acropora cervicornis TaxID=6130 RepID=A0AAD9QYZ8_ACRCE|nr:hypothetical protein P5673_005728 [Acropora cervicornis]
MVINCDLKLARQRPKRREEREGRIKHEKTTKLHPQLPLPSRSHCSDWSFLFLR